MAILQVIVGNGIRSYKFSKGKSYNFTKEHALEGNNGRFRSRLIKMVRH